MNKKKILLLAASAVAILLIGIITAVAISYFSQIKEVETPPADESSQQQPAEPQELPAAKALKEDAEKASTNAEYAKAKDLYSQAQKLYEENDDVGRSTEMQLQFDIASELEKSQSLINRDPPLQQTGE